MKSREAIEFVVASGLCTACGVCTTVCPARSIRMVETPEGLLVADVDHHTCTSCGMCVDVCTGLHLQDQLLEDGVDPFKGQVEAAYVGRALDGQLLRTGQSGGVVTALLDHLLDSGQITQAIVTEMPEDGSLRPKAVLTADRDRIRRAQGSKYCPVAVDEALPREPVPDKDRICLVGLPCQVHGLRNAQRFRKRWRRCVTLTVGLVCEGVLAFGAMDYLIRKGGISREEVVSYQFRSKQWNGWPGDGCIRTRDAAEHCVPRKHRVQCKDVFRPVHCRLCFDQLNVLSDLVAADAWGVREDKQGATAVVVRTRRGLDALLSVEQAGLVGLDHVPVESVFRGLAVERRRRNWTAYTAAWKQMGGAVPDFKIEPRWHVDLGDVPLAPYRRQLQWARSFACLARSGSESKTTRAARRRIASQRILNGLARIVSLRRILRGVLRRILRLVGKVLPGVGISRSRGGLR